MFDMILHSAFNKIFGGNSNLLYIAIVSNGEPPEPPPVIEYEYPKFNINENGELTATYLTSNRSLSFRINDDGDLLCSYIGEDPNLEIINDELIKTI